MSQSIVQQASILIIDDELANTRILEIILGSNGCKRLLAVNDSRMALESFRRFKPDIVLLDLAMPYIDGFDLLAQFRHEPGQSDVPILILTADITTASMRRSLLNGASDFLTKPFDAIEVFLRVNNLALTRFNMGLLQRIVLDRTRDLEQSQIETVRRLALASEFRDDVTGLHTRRVGDLSADIASTLGWADVDVNLIRIAAPLHDLGKVGIPDAILLKPGKLTDDEFKIMKTHTIIGSRILSGSLSSLLNLAEQIALYHHERWDGTGYASIPANQVPEAARIVMVADVFDALIHERPYKKAWSVKDAIEEIRSKSASWFDPAVVEAFDILVASETCASWLSV